MLPARYPNEIDTNAPIRIGSAGAASRRRCRTAADDLVRRDEREGERRQRGHREVLGRRLQQPARTRSRVTRIGRGDQREQGRHHRARDELDLVQDAVRSPVEPRLAAAGELEDQHLVELHVRASRASRRRPRASPTRSSARHRRRRARQAHRGQPQREHERDARRDDRRRPRTPPRARRCSWRGARPRSRPRPTARCRAS